MRHELDQQRSRPPVVRRMTAGLILVGVGALAVWIVIGLLKTIVLVALVIAAVVAVGWALKTLVW